MRAPAWRYPTLTELASERHAKSLWARSSADGKDPVLLRTVAVCGRGAAALGGRVAALPMLRSEHADREDLLDTVDMASSSLHESVSLASSWPHQSAPQRLPVGERALLGRAVDRPDNSDAAQLKSDSSPAA
jgi:hypothetical protein